MIQFNNNMNLQHINGGEGVHISPSASIPEPYQNASVYAHGIMSGCFKRIQSLSSNFNLTVGLSVGKLTSLKIKHLEKAGRYQDGNGLIFIVNNKQSKSWVYRFQLDGKRRDMGLGKYPTISLSEARKLRDNAAKLISSGIDPIEYRKAQNYAINKAKTFEQLATEFIEMKRPEWKNAKHAQQWTNTLQYYAYPLIGGMDIPSITTPIVKLMLEPIWLAKPETATRVRSRVENIIDYGIALGYSDKANPAALKVVSKILPANPKSKRVKHFSAMPYSDIPEFWQALSKNNTISANALKFTILTACRTNEAISANVSEFKDGLWILPQSRTKSGREHRVPLSKQAISLMDNLPVINGFLFPSAHYKSDHISNMAMLKFLKSDMGLNFTVHGFRSTFRDWVEEKTDYDSRLAEACLAHAVKDKTEAAYQRGDLLEKRRVLMQAWADYLTGE